MSNVNSGQNFSPYSTTTQTAAPALDMDVTNQIKQYKEEEKEHAAPRELPFTLTDSMEHVSAAYISLLKLRQSLAKTSQEPNANNAAIKKAQDTIDSAVKKIVIDLPNDLDKLYL
jgi:hypothetical protein